MTKLLPSSPVLLLLQSVSFGIAAASGSLRPGVGSSDHGACPIQDLMAALSKFGPHSTASYFKTNGRFCLVKSDGAMHIHQTWGPEQKAGHFLADVIDEAEAVEDGDTPRMWRSVKVHLGKDEITIAGVKGWSLADDDWDAVAWDGECHKYTMYKDTAFGAEYVSLAFRFAPKCGRESEDDHEILVVVHMDPKLAPRAAKYFNVPLGTGNVFGSYEGAKNPLKRRRLDPGFAAGWRPPKRGKLEQDASAEVKGRSPAPGAAGPAVMPRWGDSPAEAVDGGPGGMEVD